MSPLRIEMKANKKTGAELKWKVKDIFSTFLRFGVKMPDFLFLIGLQTPSFPRYFLSLLNYKFILF